MKAGFTVGRKEGPVMLSVLDTVPNGFVQVGRRFLSRHLWPPHVIVLISFSPSSHLLHLSHGQITGATKISIQKPSLSPTTESTVKATSTHKSENDDEHDQKIETWERDVRDSEEQIHSIGGLNEALSSLRELVLFSLVNPQAFSRFSMDPPKGKQRFPFFFVEFLSGTRMGCQNRTASLSEINYVNIHRLVVKGT